MPLLVLPDGLALPESEVISQYLVAKYGDVGPSLLPAGGPEVQAKAALATRVHDVYITSVQACMYRAMDVKGALPTPASHWRAPEQPRSAPTDAVLQASRVVFLERRSARLMPSPICALFSVGSPQRRRRWCLR
jgi:glutathione S-transferase